LTACDDFNLMDAFGMLDLEGSGMLTVEQLYRVLLALDLNLVIDDCKLFFRRHNQEQDGRLKYSEFTEAFLPLDEKYARLLGTRQLKYCHPPSRLSFQHETFKTYL